MNYYQIYTFYLYMIHKKAYMLKLVKQIHQINFKGSYTFDFNHQYKNISQK